MKKNERRKKPTKNTPKRPVKARSNKRVSKSNGTGKGQAGKRVKKNNSAAKGSERTVKKRNKVNRKAKKNDVANGFNGGGNKEKRGGAKKAITKKQTKKSKKVSHAKQNENKRSKKTTNVRLGVNVKRIPTKGKGVNKGVKRKGKPVTKVKDSVVRKTPKGKENKRVFSRAKSKTEKLILAKKYRNNSKIKELQELFEKKYSSRVIEQRENELNKKPVVKTMFEGRMRNPKTIRDIIYKRIFELNETNEEYNREIERKVKKKGLAGKGKVTEKTKLQRTFGIQRFEFYSWQMKDALDYLLVKKYNNGFLLFFNGIDLKTDANDAVFTLDNIFLKLAKYDVFILLVNLAEMDATYEIEYNGYYNSTRPNAKPVKK